MSKYLMRMGTKKERFLVLMKILSVEIPVRETVTRMSVEWKRGNKKSETKSAFELTPDKPIAYVNETFSKNSVFYRSTKTGKYFKKLAQFRVKGYPLAPASFKNGPSGASGQGSGAQGAKEKILGEIVIDISLFMNSAGDTKTLQLNKAPPNSRIELQISIQRDDGTLKLNPNGGLQNNFIDDSSSADEDSSYAPSKSGSVFIKSNPPNLIANEEEIKKQEELIAANSVARLSIIANVASNDIIYEGVGAAEEERRRAEMEELVRGKEAA
jgi:hypothetical protein